MLPDTAGNKTSTSPDTPPRSNDRKSRVRVRPDLDEAGFYSEEASIRGNTVHNV